MFSTPIAVPRAFAGATPRPASPVDNSPSPGLHRAWTTGVLVVALLAWAAAARAQLPVPASSQFDITGFIQSATLDSSCSASAHCGGTIVVNGHTVVVPAETIVILPANALTWQELFTKAPAPYTNRATGMAMSDLPAPLTTWEASVIGNRVLSGGTDRYIAGLINISQQGLNSGAGFINFIDYDVGEMRVGGKIPDANCVASATNAVAGGPACSGSRVRINDPVGRYGRASTSPDVRFTVDPDNPTIMAGTGYPMCLPRSSPTGATPDTACPDGNRPQISPGIYAASFTTNNLTNPNFTQFPGVFPDSTRQAPFEVGDYVTYSGTLVQDCASCAGGGTIAGPWPAAGAGATWVSAHTIVNNVAIFTFQGSNPAYVETDVTIIGTGGLTVLGAGEAAIRTRFEGMMTDPSRQIHLYGIDYDVNGNATDRDLGTIGVDPGPPNGAVMGRWRFRPPCLAFGSAPTKPDKQCVGNASGTFLPPPREVRAVIYDPVTLAVSNPGMASTSANGLVYGQYHAPILEYIFPENIPGSPIVENNFNAIPFLSCGGYSSSGIPGGIGTLAGALNPWPSNVLPVSSNCVGFVAAPSAVTATATPASVVSGTQALVTLSASASGTSPLTYAWTQAATDAVQVGLTNAGSASATFTTPSVSANTTLNFTVTVSNSAGSATGTVSVVVSVDQPVVNVSAPASAVSGTPVTMNITGTDPAGRPLTYTVTQTAGPAPNTAPLKVTAVAGGATATFTETLTLGAPSVVLTFSVVATNDLGGTSAPVSVSITINPLPDSLAVTSAEYRTSKQRLIVNITDSVVSANIVLKLQPYVTATGSTYNPDPAAGGVGNTFTNNGGGLYILDMVGAPRPACNGTAKDATSYATPCSLAPLDVKSSQGGDSGFFPLSRIRQ